VEIQARQLLFSLPLEIAFCCHFATLSNSDADSVRLEHVIDARRRWNESRGALIPAARRSQHKPRKGGFSLRLQTEVEHSILLWRNKVAAQHQGMAIYRAGAATRAADWGGPAISRFDKR
jgi:hypothetical protein